MNDNHFLQQLQAVQDRMALTKINSTDIVFNKYYDQTLFIQPKQNKRFKEYREKLYMEAHKLQKYAHHDSILTHSLVDQTPQFQFIDMPKKRPVNFKRNLACLKSSIDYEPLNQCVFERLYPQYLTKSKRECIDLKRSKSNK
ncbi:hypothetical protein SS50377_26830 [Spironucleus salmonicida]|uniref:Uncharacterized protein n=1 Tax=Spironucleus salmonicida TaxID=348837 RepID=A0A9P8LLR8_9EUKA|nr:hypothetical protein SS50377_26830 [Spironucleus salmonicida]